MATSKLGARVRAMREQKELSRDDLAERSGLAPSFIAALEDEELYPSLGPLLKITRALGTRLGTFMDDLSVADPLVVRRDKRSEELAMHGARETAPTLRYYSLGKGKADRHMEPFFIELAPGDATKSLSHHEGEELIIVVSGRVELNYGGEHVELDSGDSVYFNSVVPHWVGCAGSEPASIYAVLYFPE